MFTLRLALCLFLAASAMPDVETARYVLSTRHGELARTISIIDTLNDEEELSPTEFSMSIHHGLTGLLSIAKKNTGGHSAIAAGPENFWFVMPATFTMAPSVARLPRRPTTPPVRLKASAKR